MLTQIYQAEYESTPISKSELQSKYNLDTLPDEHTSWRKQANLTPISTQPQSELTTQDIVDDAKRKLAIYARDALAEGSFLEVKEVKELSAIISNLDDKKASTQGPTVNVLVQNLVSRFAEEDV